LFGARRKQNKPYFEKKVPQGKIPFYNLTGDSKNEAIVNYLWFYDPQNESSLNCGDRNLGYVDRAFGVLRTGEASAQKNSYTLTEIEKANSEVIPVVFANARMPALTDMVARPLNKGLLERLRKQ